jgi:hypothetical protein
MTTPTTPRRHDRRDAGAILPLVLVMTIVIAMIVAALATYVASGLRFGHVAEARADRLAAADGGLRYGIERLGNSQYPACLSNLGNAGHTIEFPAQVNGAEVSVTCQKASGGISDIKAWAIVVTGANVPPGLPMLTSQSGGGGPQKLLGGPVWVTDPDRSRTDLQAPVTVENGDIWYYRADCPNATLDLDEDLSFTPAFRGTQCIDKPWDQIYDVPCPKSAADPEVCDWTVAPVPQTDAPAPDTTSVPGCTIFSPGKYTTPPALSRNNYFRAGEYYFVDFTWDITDATVVAGFAKEELENGDQQFLANAPCEAATFADSNSGSTPGATFYLGGTARIEIGNKGSLEILRRAQGADFVSIQALKDMPAPYVNSSLNYTTDILWTQSGNNSDLALHGQAWAPFASMTFGNVTNSANGQILGGAAFARIHLQASASASAFIIRVETSPALYSLLVKSVATLNGRSTTMHAVVQVDDQASKLAVNSLRVVD